MLAIGAGGLDVAVAMGGGPYYVPMPRVIARVAHGRAPPVGVGQGRDPGAAAPLHGARRQRQDLRVRRARARPRSRCPQRATICNMGAELTLTTSVFPSDEATREYFAPPRARGGVAAARRRRRRRVRRARSSSTSSALEPLVALPGSPDRVVPVAEVEGTPIEQVMVGSCTNSSWEDMWAVAHVHPRPARGAVAVLRGLPGQRAASSRSWRARDCSPICSPPAPSSPSPPAAPAPASATCRPRAAEPARLQPQLPGTERHQGRRGLPLLAADRRRLRAHRA